MENSVKYKKYSSPFPQQPIVCFTTAEQGNIYSQSGWNSELKCKKSRCCEILCMCSKMSPKNVWNLIWGEIMSQWILIRFDWLFETCSFYVLLTVDGEVIALSPFIQFGARSFYPQMTLLWGYVIGWGKSCNKSYEWHQNGNWVAFSQ